MGNAGLVEILLSTYNGEEYLAEQLASIEAQNYQEIVLRIRDDGSSDGTKRLLEEFSREREWVSVSFGRNLGVVGSFLDLVDQSSSSARFVAFCDQDDVWHRDKVERAVRRLSVIDENIPAMYFSRTNLIDENGRSIGVGAPRYRIGVRNAVVQNVATGCTVVINGAAKRRLSGRNLDMTRVSMHDWWVYLVISAFGVVLYDDNPTLGYRQHQGNVIGARTGISLWKERARRLIRRRRDLLVRQVEEMLRLYGGELPEESRIVCQRFVSEAGSRSVFRRLRYAWSSKCYRQTLSEELLWRGLLVFGWR